MAVEAGSGRSGARVAAGWAALLALVVLGFVVTVITLNNTLYSAAGFVGSYLHSLARDDIADVLDTEGVTVPDAAPALLSGDAVGELTGIRLLSDTDRGGGVREVVYGYELDGTRGSSRFEVISTGPRMGVFAGWRFTTSPTAVLEVTPVNLDSFEANGVPVDAVPSTPVALAVLVPAAVTLEHESELVESPPSTALLREPGVAASATVTPQATARFVEVVQEELDGLLEDCITQQVLLPTGCPFGRPVRDRIQGLPEWSMVQYPQVAIVQGDGPGLWTVPESGGVAHIRVEVRSLFDGSLSVIDEDVPFSVGYQLSIGGEGGIRITGS